MKENLPQRKQIRLKYYNYANEGMYFITICIQNRKNILKNITLNNRNQNYRMPVGVDDPTKNYSRF